MQSKKNSEENREKSRRTLRFGTMGLFVMLMNAVLDFIRGIPVSGILILLLAFVLVIILWTIHKGYTRGTVAAIVFTVNPFLVLIAFAEGLQTGGYLFILPLLFALTFLMGNIRVYFVEMTSYFFITICSFCVCILFCNETTRWQNISFKLATQMFTFNSISVVCLCALFAYTGIYFERRYKAALLSAKNKAEMQEQKIKGQNKHLQEIAFMNAHVIRSPLANILALTALLKPEKITDAWNKEMIQHLQTSVQQLDDAIREIVAKATDDKRG